MAVITLDPDLRIGPGSGLGQRRFDLVAASESTGAEQARPMGPPRWTLNLTQPGALSPEESGAWRALVSRLRGRINHLAAWDIGREQPLGTMRGTPTLSGTHVAGATTAVLATAQPGCTVAQGDMLQFGTGIGTSQLIQVSAPATADGSGALTFTFESPLRVQLATATAVTWWRPLAYFRLQAEGVAWRYGRGCAVAGISLDFLESWTS